MLIAIACLYLLKYDTILSYFIPLIYIISCTSALSITKIESKFFGEKHGGSEKKKKEKRKSTGSIPSQPGPWHPRGASGTGICRQLCRIGWHGKEKKRKAGKGRSTSVVQAGTTPLPMCLRENSVGKETHTQKRRSFVTSVTMLFLLAIIKNYAYKL